MLPFKSASLILAGTFHPFPTHTELKGMLLHPLLQALSPPGWQPGCRALHWLQSQGIDCWLNYLFFFLLMQNAEHLLSIVTTQIRRRSERAVLKAHETATVQCLHFSSSAVQSDLEGICHPSTGLLQLQISYFALLPVSSQHKHLCSFAANSAGNGDNLWPKCWPSTPLTYSAAQLQFKSQSLWDL